VPRDEPVVIARTGKGGRGRPRGAPAPSTGIDRSPLREEGFGIQGGMLVSKPSITSPPARPDRGLLAPAAVLLILGLGGSAFAQQGAAPSYIKSAIDSASRPAADVKVDSLRKPAELIAFAGLKPGDRLLELIPSRGYFTRLFSLVVGPAGHVDELVTAEEVKASATAADPIKAIAADPAFKNVSVSVQPVSAFKVSQPVDLVWTSQNYHDLHDTAFGPADMAAFDKAVFDALKPGGIFLVVDHAASSGRGLKDTQTLHRIDQAAAEAEIEAAGFKLDAQSDVLRNPEDDHTLKIFDAKIRGKTDKFVLKFKKPG